MSNINCLNASVSSDYEPSIHKQEHLLILSINKYVHIHLPMVFGHILFNKNVPLGSSYACPKVPRNGSTVQFKMNA